MIMEKIFLLDINRAMINCWNEAFVNCGDVYVVNKDFKTFISKNDEVDGIVSPGNSFGLMDGGYDKAISEYFGDALYEAVQNKIMECFWGEQPVGSCLSLQIPNTKKILLHTSTMRTPEVIIDPRIIYSCMRTTLVETEKNSIKQIVVPAFGGMTGRVPRKIIAQMMREAYDDVNNRRRNKGYNTWSNIREINLWK
jgi:O-acetyl-ADP-ribose deacetylase (regulator of RNase III)